MVCSFSMMKQTKYLTNQKKTNKKIEQTNLLWPLLFGQKIKQKLKQGTYNTAQDSENKEYTESNTY